MPKLMMTRWVLGIVVVSFAALGVAIAWQSEPSGAGRMPSAPAISDRADFARRQSELSFLKASFDRLEAEAKQEPNGPVLHSLRTEQEAIALRMREVARPLSAESLPPELRAWANDEPRAVAKAEPPAAAAPRPATEPMPPAGAANASDSAAAAPELKLGLGSSSPAPDLALSRDPALNLVILIARPRPPRPVREPTTEKSAEPQAANPEAANPEVKAARARAAEKAAARPAAGDSAGLTEPTRAEPATAAR